MKFNPIFKYLVPFRHGYQSDTWYTSWYTSWYTYLASWTSLPGILDFPAWLLGPASSTLDPASSTLGPAIRAWLQPLEPGYGQIKLVYGQI